MKIVIDVPEKLILEGFERTFTEEEKNILIKAIGNGTPLPKGHGRLIDVGKYEKEYFNVAIQYDDGNHIHSDYTNTIPTIIEVDKAESEDKE